MDARRGPQGREGGVLVLSELYLPARGGHVIWLHEVCRRLDRPFLVAGACGRAMGCETVDGVPVLRADFSRKWYLRPESLGMYVRMHRLALDQGHRLRPRLLLAPRALPEAAVAGHAPAEGERGRVLVHGREVHGLGR